MRPPRPRPEPAGRRGRYALRESLLWPPGRNAAPVVLHDEHELAVSLCEADVDEARVRVPHDVREQLARGREDELVLCVVAGAVQIETEGRKRPRAAASCATERRAASRPRRLEDVRMEVEDGLPSDGRRCRGSLRLSRAGGTKSAPLPVAVRV